LEDRTIANLHKLKLSYKDPFYYLKIPELHKSAKIRSIAPGSALHNQQTTKGQKMHPAYKPYEERTPDMQYRDRLRLILEEGEEVESQQGVPALTYIAPPPMRFLLENGVPLITERKIPFWRAAVGELLAFANGARTQKELEEFGCKWWSSWLTHEKCAKRGLEDGDAGPGSYGAAFHDFPTVSGESFNQIRHLVEQIREEPQLRTHFVSPWIPQYVGRGKGKKQKVVVAPCHGWMHIRILPKDRLVLHMFQRSADFPVGVPSNMIQYAAFTILLATVTGKIPYMFVHSFSDAHIYVDQIPHVQEILAREPRPFPTLTLNLMRENIFDYRASDFDLQDYNPHSAIAGIPVAI
jgi:thymidylate synthase